jgi:hypothetical protein
MKKTLAASLFTLAMFAACSGNAASSVPGTYHADVREMMNAMMPVDAKADPEAAKKMDEAVKNSSITMELKADNTATMNAKMAGMGDHTETGTWKLDGTKLSITTKEKDGKEETKVADYSNGMFTVELDMGGKKVKMTFKKK